MKIIALTFCCIISSAFPINTFAKDDGSRGAVYELHSSVLGITEDSFKLIDRADNGEHAHKIVEGEISTMAVKTAVEKILTDYNLYEEKLKTLSPNANLLIEFEGRVSNLLLSNICRGKDGNYLAVSVPDIYYAENFTVNIRGRETNIKQLVIGTDPSAGLVLQKKLLWGSVGEYLRFFLKRMDSDRKFKVQGLINYAEQTRNENEIEKLELVITVIKISITP